jgi:hypothetical protein
MKRDAIVSSERTHPDVIVFTIRDKDAR